MSNDDLPYIRSRSANRRLFGQRSIDASAPLSARSGTGAGVGERPLKGGLTPEPSWRRFFDRPAPLGTSGPTLPADYDPAFVDPETVMKGDPSKSFQMAGAPPIGGPSTGTLPPRGLPRTPTAMQYYEEGIKGLDPLPSVSQPAATIAKYGAVGVSNKANDPEIAAFFKRYRAGNA